MRTNLTLIAAPTAMQPGEYVPVAYKDATRPATPNANLVVEKSPLGWNVQLTWPCAKPVDDIRGDTNRFADAAALLVPLKPGTPMITMGSEGFGVEGVLWRPDWKVPMKITAEGFGTVVRHAPPADWHATATWQNGIRSVLFRLARWPALDKTAELGVAIWQGAQSERAGLKSVTADWIKVVT